jgi:release factor glutamine methyltransferase
VLLLDSEPAGPQAAAFDGMVSRRAGGEPLQYVLGTWGFRRLDLMVDRRVLIPRPETEQVVEVALEEVRRVRSARQGPIRGADLGTGSGAIALALAHEAADVEVWATDRSPDALAVARANLVGTGTSVAGRVHLAAGDWFEALPGELRGALDLIVSNPPYVAAGEVLPPEVRDWEPMPALIAGPTGLEAITHLLDAAPAWLAPGGAVVLELAPHQAAEAAALAGAAGLREVRIRPDLTGRQRILVGRQEAEV